MEVIGQSIEIVPAGLVTVAPDMTTSAPIVIDPPVLLSMIWLANARGAMRSMASANAIATRRGIERNAETGRAGFLKTEWTTI